MYRLLDSNCEPKKEDVKNEKIAKYRTFWLWNFWQAAL